MQELLERVASMPPETRTSPLKSRSASCSNLAVIIDPVRVHVPEDTLKTSAVARTPPPYDELQPIVSTLPLGSKKSLKLGLAVVMEPVGIQVCVAGLYKAAVAEMDMPTTPPATKI